MPLLNSIGQEKEDKVGREEKMSWRKKKLNLISDSANSSIPRKFKKNIGNWVKQDNHGAISEMSFGYMACKIKISKVENDKSKTKYFCRFFILS